MSEKDILEFTVSKDKGFSFSKRASVTAHEVIIDGVLYEPVSDFDSLPEPDMQKDKKRFRWRLGHFVTLSVILPLGYMIYGIVAGSTSMTVLGVVGAFVAPLFVYLAWIVAGPAETIETGDVE